MHKASKQQHLKIQYAVQSLFYAADGQESSGEISLLVLNVCTAKEGRAESKGESEYSLQRERAWADYLPWRTLLL